MQCAAFRHEMPQPLFPGVVMEMLIYLWLGFDFDRGAANFLTYLKHTLGLSELLPSELTGAYRM
jgi:hypothetical protein